MIGALTASRIVTNRNLSTASVETRAAYLLIADDEQRAY